MGIYHQFTTSGLVTQYYANEFGTNPGVYTESANVPVKPGIAATLQYLNVAVQGASVTATLADTHAAEISVQVRSKYFDPRVRDVQVKPALVLASLDRISRTANEIIEFIGGQEGEQ